MFVRFTKIRNVQKDGLRIQACLFQSYSFRALRWETSLRYRQLAEMSVRVWKGGFMTETL